MTKLAVVYLIIFPKLVYLLIVSSKIPPTLNLSQKSSPPLVPPTEISRFGSPPFCGCPYSFIIFKLPPTRISLRITGYKLTTNTLRYKSLLTHCVISCNTHEQKQVGRSKLIFQIHKQTHSVHNRIYTQLQEIA